MSIVLTPPRPRESSASPVAPAPATRACTVRRLDGGYLSDGWLDHDPSDGSLLVWNLTEPGALLLEYYGRTVSECLLVVDATPTRVRLTRAAWSGASGRTFRFRRTNPPTPSLGDGCCTLWAGDGEAGRRPDP